MTITADSAPYNAAAVRSWLRILHGDCTGLIHICSTGDWAGRTFSDLDAATRYVTYLNSEGREGIYARVTTLKTALAPGRRGGAIDTDSLPALWADIDIAGPGHAHDYCADGCDIQHTHICREGCTQDHRHITRPLPPDQTAGQAIIAASGLPEPTLWIHSGGGLYPIWLLDKPHAVDNDNRSTAMRLSADWQRAIEHAAETLGWFYGRGVSDIARVLRVPGTVNRKEGLARPCLIISATANRYSIEQLRSAADAAIARIPAPAPPTATSSRTQLRAVDRPAGHITPGDDYNQRTDWASILEPAGWREYYREDQITYWTRPGKTTGTSASTNALGTDNLHVFTTSALPLEGGENYSKLGAYAELCHGGDHAAAVKALAAAGYGTPLPDPGIEQREALADILGGPVPLPDPPTRAPAAVPGREGWTAEVDATNPAIAADWLRANIGQGRLAGYFARGHQIVHTPRQGEEGYIATIHNEAGDDGPAQVRPINDSTLASRINLTYGVFRYVKRGENYEPTPTLFPRSAARVAVDVPDMMPYLRALRGVVHSPVLRADGSVLSAPGYDDATGLLYLPEPGLTVPPVPDNPTSEQTADAAALLEALVGGFAFVSKHDKANYLGLLLTPLLRAMAPPPYQLAAITAPNPGSGKTLLATLVRILHGGVFRAEMPQQEEELRKQITTILDYTTGPVVHFDNVSGVLRSPTIAALLTSGRWDDRKLGANEMISAKNDRLWMITGNNLSLGGDLTRRTIWVTIDPNVPNPHLRTDFAIKDLERWTRDNRGALLHALLTLARRWITTGMPIAASRGSDAYSRWVQITGGILATAGVEGEFAAAESARQEIGADDDEWSEFLAHIYGILGEDTWTVKDLLAQIDSSNGSLIPSGPIPFDALPAELADKATRPTVGVHGIGKSLGRWLRNREGRWAGDLTVRQAYAKGRHGVTWRIEKAGPR